MRKLKPGHPASCRVRSSWCRLVSHNTVLQKIGVPAQRISEIVTGKRAITADTDLRLCRFFGLSNGYWLRAQVVYDTEIAEDALAKTLSKITPWKGLQAHTSHQQA